MDLPEMLEGKTITTARVEDGVLYLQLGANEQVVALVVLGYGYAEIDGQTLQ